MKRLIPLLLLWAGMAAGHEVHHAVVAGNAVVVTLRYADGSPFAYEKYELYPAGRDVPMQVGNSDAQGHVVFLPGDVREWRLKAFSADGHGTDLRFDAPAVATAAPAAGDTSPGRIGLVLFGLSIILGGFGLYQMLLRKKTP